MSGREELTAESEALHLDWHAGNVARCKGADCPGLAHCRAIEAAAEERAVARHVRETGCEGYRVVLLDGARSWHADAPVPGVATLTIDFGGDRSALAKVVTRINALAPTVAASDVSCIHLPGHPDDCEECDCTPSPATEAERSGGEG